MNKGRMIERRMRREGGFALLIVLWSLALLALLGTQLMASARTELQLASNIRSSAVLEAEADGLVYATIFRLMSGSPEQRGVDGLDHAAAVPGGRGIVRVTSLAGKVNPNTASEALLSALLQRVGVAAKPAASLAAAIVDWRTPGQLARPLGAKGPQYRAAGLPYSPPGTPFETIEELRQVLGMTPDLVARLAPHMSVHYPGDPVRSAADPLVLGILRGTGTGEDGTPPEGAEDGGVYVQIDATAMRAGGQAFTRRAAAWAGHGARRGRYLVLGWDVAALQ